MSGVQREPEKLMLGATLRLLRRDWEQYRQKYLTAEGLRATGRRDKMYFRQAGKAAIVAMALSPVVTLALVLRIWNFVPAPDSRSLFVTTWSSMAMNFWLPMILPAYALVRFLPALQIRARRRPPGFCAGCGYDMRSLGSGVCPECGREVDLAAEERERWMTPRRFRRWRGAWFVVTLLFAIQWCVQRIRMNDDAPLEPLEWASVATSPLVFLAAFVVFSLIFEGALVWNEGAERGRSGR